MSHNNETYVYVASKISISQILGALRKYVEYSDPEELYEDYADTLNMLAEQIRQKLPKEEGAAHV